MKKEEIEKLFWEGSSPKIKHIRDDLRRNENFLKEIDSLRKKWADLIKEYNLYFKEMIDRLEKENPQITRDEKDVLRKMLDKIEKGVLQITKEEKDAFLSSTKRVLKPVEKEKEFFISLFKKAYRTLEDDDFDKDIINLCYKYKLYPADFWIHPIKNLIARDEFAPVNFWLGIGLSNYFSNKEIISMSQGLTFVIKIEINKKTKEPELVVKIPENVSQRDLRKNLTIITKCQKKLREIKNINKRSCVYRNLEKAKTLKELDKPIEYYEPTIDKWVQEKISEQKKIKIIYGKNPKNKKERKRLETRMKVMRHRDRKRTKS